MPSARHISVLAAAALLAASSGLASAQVSYSIVALSGTQAPGTQGRIFDTFANVVINNAGRVIFFADLTGSTTDDATYWSNASGVLELIARESDAAPLLVPGPNFELATTLPIYLDDSNRPAFFTDLEGTGITASNDICFWTTRTGTLSLIAREGDPAPGTGPGIVFAPDGIITPRVAPSGLAAFHARLAGAGITTANDRIIYTEAFGSLRPVAREGNPAPGLLPDQIFASIGLDISPLGGQGQVAFLAALAGPTITTADNDSVWYASAAGAQLLAREQSQAPGLQAGVNFTTFGSPGMSPSGIAAITANFTGPLITPNSDRGIFVGTPGNLALVVRESDPAPGFATGTRFAALTFDAKSINSAGRIAFAATLSGSDVSTANDSTLWANPEGQLRLIAREGTSAPELPPGIIFLDSFSIPLINESGQVAFTATISGPGVTSGNNETLWATDSLGNLVLIAREGTTQIDINPDPATTTLRTIASFEFNTIQGQSGFNNRGELALDVRFTDASDAVVIAALPVITQCPTCPADFDQDGGVTGADIEAFFTAFQAGTACGDTDQDGGITGADIEAFFVAFEAGGC